MLKQGLTIMLESNHDPKTRPNQGSADTESGRETPDSMSVKPVSRTLVLGFLIEECLRSSNPVEQLHALQSDGRFRFPEAQADYCHSLWEVERRHFEDLRRTGQYSPEMIGATRHHGEIFSLLNVHDIHSAQIGAWLELVNQELAYLRELPEWGDLDGMLASHAFGIIDELVIAAPDEWIGLPEARTRIAKTLEGMSYKLLSEDSSVPLPNEYELTALLTWLDIGCRIGSDSLKAEVLSRLPQLIAIWKSLDEGDDDIEDETIGSEHVDNSAPQPEYLAEELDGWNSRETYDDENLEESISNNEDQTGPTWTSSLESNEFEAWEDAVTLALRATYDRVDSDEYLLEIIHSADMSSELWHAAFEGLLLCSYQESLAIVKNLLADLPEETSGLYHITGLLDPLARADEFDYFYEPSDILRAAIADLPDKQRKKTIQLIRETLREEAPWTIEIDTMEQTFERIIRRPKPNKG